MSIGKRFFQLRYYGLVLPLAAMVLAGIWQLTLAEGTLLLLSDSPLEATLDGKPLPLAQAGGAWRSPLPRGSHQLQVRLPGAPWNAVPLEVHNGFDLLVVPAQAGQCFVLVDRQQLKIRVVARSTPGQPMTVPQGAALGISGLKDHPNAANVIVDLDCAAFAATNDQLAAQLGGGAP